MARPKAPAHPEMLTAPLGANDGPFMRKSFAFFFLQNPLQAKRTTAPPFFNVGGNRAISLPRRGPGATNPAPVFLSEFNPRNNPRRRGTTFGWFLRGSFPTRTVAPECHPLREKPRNLSKKMARKMELRTENLKREPFRKWGGKSSLFGRSNLLDPAIRLGPSTIFGPSNP